MKRSSWGIFLFISFTLLFIGCASDFVPINESDMSPLYVVNTVPADGSTGVKRDLGPTKSVLINFSKAIDKRYADSDFIDFTCNGEAVNFKISLSQDSKVLNLTLRSNTLLPERADCRVVLSKLIRDTVGLPLYLNPTGSSTYLSAEDGGVNNDLSSTDLPSKDKRVGEGDYILHFETEFLPLEIANISPAHNEKIPTHTIPSFEGVRITFNKSLDPYSVNTSNFLLKGEEIEPLLSEDLKLVTLRPLRALEEGKVYTVMIMPSVTDSSGIMLSKPYIYTFSTDYLPPEVVSTSIKDGSTDVDYTINSIRIDFNKDMDPSTVNRSTIRLNSVGKYSVRYENRSAYIEGFALLERRDYSVYISPLIMDESGFYLRYEYEIHFRTSYSVPFVKSIFPQDKAAGVPLNLKSIDIEFSEDMDLVGIGRGLFSISPYKDFQVEIKDRRNVSLIFNEVLTSGTTYTVKVSPLLMDTSGITMDKDFVSSFRASLTPDNNPPSDITIYYKRVQDPVDKLRQGFIIEWKSPGDNIENGLPVGKVRSYRLVYSDSPFERSEFDSMTQLSGLPTPLPVGGVQSITLYSLIDIHNNEIPLVYNSPYYFMLSATDGTNVVYSNLLRAGILSDPTSVLVGSKFLGWSLKKMEGLDGEDLILLGDTDEVKDNLRTGAVSIMRIRDSTMMEIKRLYGRDDQSLFGYSMEVLDLDSDGCKDIAISAPLDGINREGAVYVYFQDMVQNVCTFKSYAPVRLSGGIRDSFFGFSLTKVIYNGKESLLVGAPSDGPLNYGAVYIYQNRPNRDQIPLSGDIKIVGGISGGSFGYALLYAELSGDRCDDIVISSPDASIASRGEVYVFYSTSGITGCGLPNFNVNSPSLVLKGSKDLERFGSRLFGSDLDGDGRPELFVSAKEIGPDKGIVYVRRSKNGEMLKIYGEPGGDFGYAFAEAEDYLKDGCKGSAGNCRDVLVSDEHLGRIYLLEGKQELSYSSVKDLPEFGWEYNLPSFGHTLLVYKEGIFEDLLVTAPYVSNFGGFESGIFIYK